MSAIAQRRTAIAAALFVLLYLLQVVVLMAPPARAATELGGLIADKFTNWDPAPNRGWTPGQNPNYFEGDVVPFSFEVAGATPDTSYQFTACFDYYVDPPSKDPAYAGPDRSGPLVEP
ncbi:MAG TPA: hypothetical protein VIY70_02225, partial [Acidimicrobiia bacterium]